MILPLSDVNVHRGRVSASDVCDASFGPWSFLSALSSEIPRNRHLPLTFRLAADVKWGAETARTTANTASAVKSFRILIPSVDANILCVLKLPYCRANQ
ncbi:MAG: hypothetical protein VCE91_16595 [Nitrospinota bacterium]